MVVFIIWNNNERECSTTESCHTSKQRSVAITPEISVGTKHASRKTGSIVKRLRCTLAVRQSTLKITSVAFVTLFWMGEGVLSQV